LNLKIVLRSVPLEGLAMTTNAVGFQAVWADSWRYLALVLEGVGQILEGLLIQREFLLISLHFGSLILRTESDGPNDILHSHAQFLEGGTGAIGPYEGRINVNPFITVICGKVFVEGD
jgi:hypothetical protein